MIANGKILILQTLNFGFLLLIIFSLVATDAVVIDSIVESDEHYSAVYYSRTISTGKNLGELSQLVDDLDDMDVKNDQYYEFYHKHILIVNEDLEFIVDIHYIDEVIWERINASSDLIIYNPRRKHFPMYNELAGMEQIEWEWYYLKKSDIILFWFSDGSPNPIVMFEYGKWMFPKNKPIFVGVDPNYERKFDVASLNDFHKNTEPSALMFKKNQRQRGDH